MKLRLEKGRNIFSPAGRHMLRVLGKISQDAQQRSLWSSWCIQQRGVKQVKEFDQYTEANASCPMSQ
jgi:hypothetical protein